jgi:glutamine synthetase
MQGIPRPSGRGAVILKISIFFLDYFEFFSIKTKPFYRSSYKYSHNYGWFNKMANAEAERILESVKKDNVKFMDLQFTDLFGNVKSLTIPVEYLDEALEKGVWFDGSSIEGFTRISESDMYLVPDPGTYSVIPWRVLEKGSTARMICDVYKPDGTPFEGDPRGILKSVLAEAKEMGFTYNTGPELEFFLFKSEDGSVSAIPHDKGGYFDLSQDLAYGVRRDMIFALEKLGVTVEMAHHEVAEGQHEIAFKYGKAVETADSAVTLKYAFKAIAHMHGLHATFMPKPIFGVNGSGMHVHQSLFDSKGNNAFFDKDGEYKLSETAKSFIAGQLKYIREFAAVVAPTVNSYKRLVPGYEAPVYTCWGQRNRSALIRVPRYSPGREKSTRCELRCPDPSTNPYLAFAVMLKAGLQGIKDKLEAPAPVEDDVYEFSAAEREKHGIEILPGSLGEAIDQMEKGKVVKEALGDHAYEQYLRNKTAEWDSFRTAVTDWEVDRYLEIL